MPAMSTLTLASIVRAPALWTKLQSAIIAKKLGPWELKVLGAGTLKVEQGKSGMVFLEGLTYQGSNAHISITGDSNGQWTYFHFTTVGKEGNSAYFTLDYNSDDEIVAKVTSTTVVAGKKVDVAKAEYFWKNVPADLVSDVGVLMRGFINKFHAIGEAV